MDIWRKIRAFFKTNIGRVVGTALFDIVLIGIGLVIFAYFHHVRPAGMDDPVILSDTEVYAYSEQVSEEEIPEDDVSEDTAITEETTSGDAETIAASDDLSYEDATASIKITKERFHESDVYIADITLKDITRLKTAFAKGKAETGHEQALTTMAENNNAVFATNGDFFGMRKKGVVIRNGVLYRKTMRDDVCVLFEDGTIEIYSEKTFNLQEVIDKKPLQSWAFGPNLLNADGSAIDGFTHSVAPKNPRTAIGYYEPGHYCLVVVDGRSSTSKGLTLTNLSKLMNKLGCAKAYNLDGGESSIMYFQGNIVNNPYKGGRSSSDIIYIGKEN